MKNLDWIGNAISIALFGVLALASWSLSEFVQRGRLAAASEAPAGPNAIIEQARIVRTDETGLPRYRLEAARIVVDNRRDASQLTEPRLITLSTQEPKTEVRAARAQASEDQNRIELAGDVVITRQAWATQPVVRVDTPRLTLWVNEERAYTDAPVYIQRGQSTLQGVGMRLDQKTQKIEIISESRMVMPRGNPP